MLKITILPDSLIDTAYNDLLKLIPIFRSGGATFQFFKFVEKTAEIIGVKSNLNHVISTLNENGVPYEFIEEDGIDEYFFARRNRADITVYLAPINNAPLVHRAAVMSAFIGHLYIFEAYPNGDIDDRPQNHDAFINASSLKASAGSKSLNKSDATYDHIKGTICSFTINGIRYTEVIGNENSADSGVEGFTQICKSNPKFRIKIWKLEKKQYDIERVEAMIKYKYKNHSIALPLALVYNNKNQPIGVVMENFKGKELSLSKIHTLSKPMDVVKQILEQMLWLQEHRYLHSDIIHNILWGETGSHVIDIDSVQFGSYFPGAYSADPLNFLPKMYNKESYFFNTVELSYTALSLVCSIFVDPSNLFVEWRNGFWSINSKKFARIENVAPEIAELIRQAHTSGKPVSIARQLDALERVNIGNRDLPTPTTGNRTPFLTFDCNAASTNDCDDEVANYPYNEGEDDIVYNNNCVNESSDYTPVGVNYTPPVVEHRDPEPDPVFHTPDPIYTDQHTGESDNTSRNSNNVITHNDFKLTMFHKLILRLFQMNTFPVNMSDYEIWIHFIKGKKWIKPLIFSTVLVFSIILLLVATILI